MGAILGPRCESDNQKSEPVKKKTVITTRKHEVWLIRPPSEVSEEQEDKRRESADAAKGGSRKNTQTIQEAEMNRRPICAMPH